MESLILHNIDKQELTQLISDAVSEQLSLLGVKHEPEQKTQNYRTRSETAKILRISLPTLAMLTSTGKIRSFKIIIREI